MSDATRPGEIWSIDFVSDSLTHGRRFRALTIVDDFTKVRSGPGCLDREWRFISGALPVFPLSRIG